MKGFTQRRAGRAAQLLQAAGEREKIVLKLRRKPKKAKEAT